MDSTNDNALTVTYGSFSVTLEGQENPFDMLRQVTNFYRKVAEENPHFGAIPATSLIKKPAEETPDYPVYTRPKQAQQAESKQFSESEPAENSTNQDSNLWQESANASDALPLVLNAPLTARENTDIAQIKAANQVLIHPETPAQPERENEPVRLVASQARSPFRHFPARTPNGG